VRVKVLKIEMMVRLFFQKKHLNKIPTQVHIEEKEKKSKTNGRIYSHL